MGEYVPTPGQAMNELPGMGGVFNVVNLHVYHYAGNNPVVISDPDGRADDDYMGDGRLIHSIILQRYMKDHISEDVVGNTMPMSGVLARKGIIDPGQGRTDIGLKPDIWNIDTNEVYEIKPITHGPRIAREQAALYVALLKKFGIVNDKGTQAHLGNSNSQGTAGSFLLPDGRRVDYGSTEPGVILYSISNVQRRNVPIENFGKVAVTAGAGYLLYKILRTFFAGVIGGIPGAATSAIAP
jgi:hypothetical protein